MIANESAHGRVCVAAWVDADGEHPDAAAAEACEHGVQVRCGERTEVRAVCVEEGEQHDLSALGIEADELAVLVEQGKVRHDDRVRDRWAVKSGSRAGCRGDGEGEGGDERRPRPSGVHRQLTTIVPSMLVWITHSYLYVPGFVKVIANVCGPAAFGEPFGARMPAFA